MRIGIESQRANNPTKTGVEHYAKQLILHLALIDTQNQYVLYLRTKPEDWFLKLPKNFTVKVIPFPIAWTQIRISLEMLLHPVDVLFIPASALPLIHPKKSVVTIHDVAWKMFPEAFTGFMRNFLHYSTKFAVRSTSSILVNSESTRRDLVQYYKVPDKKIATALFGFEDTEVYDPEKISSETKVKLPEKFILYLGTLQPRKNIVGLIAAFRLLKTEHPDLSHKLVIAGRPGWLAEPILEAIEKNKDIVVYLGHVSDSDRLALMARATLLAIPSFYEGFGMQILEAFAAGIPVVTSNVSSLPEVAGDGAEYCDPKNTDSIKQALERILLNPQRAQELAAKGKEQLKKFSWAECARLTHQVLTGQ